MVVMGVSFIFPVRHIIFATVGRIGLVGAATAARDANKGVVYEPGREVNNSPVIIEF